MFSRTVERVLNAAAREAVSRRHAHLTLEHLLFAIINETSGDKILRAAGADTEKLKADLDAFLDENLETLPLGAKRPPDQTLAFRRVLQTAVLHVQSAGKTEADVGDILAALLAQGRSHAVDLLTGQGVTRLDILNYISHGITQGPGRIRRARDRRGRRPGEEGPATARDPLGAYCVNLTERGAAGEAGPPHRPPARAAARARDPLPGAARTTPSSSAIPAWARPRSWRGWPCACCRRTPPRS